MAAAFARGVIAAAFALAAPIVAAAETRVRITAPSVGGPAEIAATLDGPAAAPVVVFIAGLGEGRRDFAAVVPLLAGCARVVRYDRPGVGDSLPVPQLPVLAEAAAADLGALLSNLRLAPPYVLVGHYLGALYAQAFARARPADTAGVVLLDGASPLEPPGIFVSTVPPEPGTAEAAEEAGVAPSQAAMLAGPPFPDVPLVVVAATDHADTPEREALWQDVQRRTAALSPEGRLVIAEGSGHVVQQDRPQIVAGAVLDVLAASGTDVTACRRAQAPSGSP
jgi:pimeloyl-ACP methyl ester carboxylesterase